MVNSVVTYAGINIENIQARSYGVPTKNTFFELDTDIGMKNGVPILASRRIMFNAKFIAEPSAPGTPTPYAGNVLDNSFSTYVGQLYSVKESLGINNTAQLIMQDDWYYDAVFDEVVVQATEVSCVDYNIQFTIPSGRRFYINESTINLIGTSGINQSVNFATLTEVDTPLKIILPTTSGNTYTVRFNNLPNTITVVAAVTGNLTLDFEAKTATRTVNNDSITEISGPWPRPVFKSAFNIIITNTNTATLKYRSAKI